MSEPLIETDADREARKLATIEIGKNAHGAPVFALELIDPNGHLVRVPIDSKLKPGHKYATQADRDRKAAEELARKQAEGKAPGAEPSAPPSEG